MAAYYRRRWKNRRKRFTPAEKQNYWDMKTLADPNKLPKNYSYNVPEVPKPKDGPSLTEVGLTSDISEIIAYYNDKSAKKPECMLHKIADHFISLLLAAVITAIAVVVGLSASNSSKSDSKLIALLGILVSTYGGYYTLKFLWLLFITPIKALRARINFKKLSATSGPSPLLGGKTLQEVERIMKEREKTIHSINQDYKAKCEARTAEIWRRHRLRIERLNAKRELEKLQYEAQQEAEKYEDENFPILAINPSYWSDGSSTEKGLKLERKFSRLLKDAGYSVELTPLSGDKGIDIIANKDDQQIVVQCKNYISKVGAGDIRDFAGALSYHREKSPKTIGWLVAPGGFTEATFEKYHRSGDIELWDFSDIQELVIETYKIQPDVSDEELGAV